MTTPEVVLCRHDTKSKQVSINQKKERRGTIAL